jgi:hypothetical protein
VDLETIGRRRLMMRLPAYRRQLETLKIPALKDLLKAYGFAAIQRDQVRAVEGHKTRHVTRLDCDCARIEMDVVRLLTNVAARAVKA